jgi:hypothetical protein
MKKTIFEYQRQSQGSILIYSGRLKTNKKVKWRKEEKECLKFLINTYGYSKIIAMNTQITKEVDKYKARITNFLSYYKKKKVKKIVFEELSESEKEVLAFIQKRHGYNSTRSKIRNLIEKVDHI